MTERVLRFGYLATGGLVKYRKSPASEVSINVVLSIADL
jgi:hypothetical protein